MVVKRTYFGLFSFVSPKRESKSSAPSLLSVAAVSAGVSSQEKLSRSNSPGPDEETATFAAAGVGAAAVCTAAKGEALACEVDSRRSAKASTLEFELLD